MSHYAKIENDLVVAVIVAEPAVIETFDGEWVQTSYRTHANQHPEGQPLRGNYAGPGDIYDRTNDVFYAQQPYPSWSLNTGTWTWTPPVPYPNDDDLYHWDEDRQSWQQN